MVLLSKQYPCSRSLYTAELVQGHNVGAHVQTCPGYDSESNPGLPGQDEECERGGDPPSAARHAVLSAPAAEGPKVQGDGCRDGSQPTHRSKDSDGESPAECPMYNFLHPTGRTLPCTQHPGRDAPVRGFDHVSRPNADVIPPEAPCSRNEPFYCSFRDVTSETRECSRGSYVSDNLYRPLSHDFRVDCELCRHWGLNRRTGAKQNCAGGVEERRGRSRFFAGAKQNGAGAKQNGGGEEEGVSWGCLTKTTTECINSSAYANSVTTEVDSGLKPNRCR
ncbi:hypothetical protein Bbelb_438480 [Branchiostoma belcheri]|nr:hypothetical protein Bbelb_438480 [Branchiostoma belcheri]